ncbi:DNA-binding FrmR family transcriptional regulator [Ruminiclostridium sufflavum DSM 19573]|uniref:DNA-binding FrmR family transcriptional regulator n=1 Tax=Ruminiclostridium sufflavum DSM 19573 TaxID=1121337 RepID=A0A318XS86_9FIRM|nr:metal-sensing transcriptional repressor [Ruminiclostridium sufflavum]PYG90404.1 DNA-binding FrmR family transcriptional regulator [Ruminiclostridium sufflavum DSM 19573]
MTHCQDVKAVCNRLSKIEGHVKGIKKMVEERKPCEDILIQIAAIEAAIHKVGQIVLENHLEGCVIDGIKEGKEQETLQKLKSALNKFI